LIKRDKEIAENKAEYVKIHAKYRKYRDFAQKKTGNGGGGGGGGSNSNAANNPSVPKNE
jgi:hypothetical protein